VLSGYAFLSRNFNGSPCRVDFLCLGLKSEVRPNWRVRIHYIAGWKTSGEDGVWGFGLWRESRGSIVRFSGPTVIGKPSETRSAGVSQPEQPVCCPSHSIPWRLSWSQSFLTMPRMLHRHFAAFMPCLTGLRRECRALIYSRPSPGQTRFGELEKG
jgi:hypothetical protein